MTVAASIKLEIGSPGSVIVALNNKVKNKSKFNVATKLLDGILQTKTDCTKNWCQTQTQGNEASRTVHVLKSA